MYFFEFFYYQKEETSPILIKKNVEFYIFIAKIGKPQFFFTQK